VLGDFLPSESVSEELVDSPDFGAPFDPEAILDPVEPDLSLKQVGVIGGINERVFPNPQVERIEREVEVLISHLPRTTVFYFFCHPHGRLEDQTGRRRVHDDLVLFPKSMDRDLSQFGDTPWITEHVTRDIHEVLSNRLDAFGKPLRWNRSPLPIERGNANGNDHVTFRG
jgi:hypothetical protein